MLMEKSFGYFFYLKKPKGYQEGLIPVYLRITVDGTSCEISCKQKADPLKWNVTAGRAVGKTEEIKLLNAWLDTMQHKVFEARRKLLERGEAISAEAIKNIMLGKEAHGRRYLLLEIFKYHNVQMRVLVGREYAPGTMERYETSLRHTQSFLKWKYGVEDIDINKLDYEFLSEYEFWLKSVRRCGHNSTMKYLSNFRKIVNQCLRKGWLPRDPFLGFKMTKREVERIALTENELQALAGKKFAAPRLSQVRDIFLFSCYTGLAYADVKKLRASEVVWGVDGEKWLMTQRQKTDTFSRIPLLPAALQIIDRYKKVGEEDGPLLPVLSNQKMNAYLKEIADLCGISKNLTYHLARHTFATTVTLTNGVPIETVSKMLGHRNLKTTQHYARILDLKIGEDMQALKRKLQEKARSSGTDQ
jgi:site-specific recombinase XerD